jgi:hypothetical protein
VEAHCNTFRLAVELFEWHQLFLFNALGLHCSNQ